MYFRSFLICVGCGTLAIAPADAQGTVTTSAIAGSAQQTNSHITISGAESNAPLLQTPVALELSDVTLRDALQVIAKQMDGRLMYDEMVASIPVRVTLKHESTAGDARRSALRGTNVRMYMLDDGRLVVLKVVKGSVPADSAEIRGRVVDSASGAPVPSARVLVTPVGRQVVSGDDGTFVIGRLPFGDYGLSVQRIGYAPTRVSVSLKDASGASVVVSLVGAPSRLQEVVTTGAGDREKLEVGNVIATVNADSIMARTPVSKVTDLLANRIPGLVVQTGSGAVGSPGRIRIRGLSSIESANSPIVYVDGIRISTDATTAVNNVFYDGVYGGERANDLGSRLDDIDPNTIESIEVMKGPSASMLYGSEAANGVIIIRTKRGEAGPARWSVYADRRYLTQPTDYEYPRMEVGYPLSGGYLPMPNCTMDGLQMGLCVAKTGEVIGFNMLKDPRFSPVATGHSQSLGARVSGGSDALQYSIGGTWLDELGTARLPKVMQSYIENGRGGKPLPEETIRPNARRNASVNARMTGSFGATSHYSLNTSFISQKQRVGNDGMPSLMDVPRPSSDSTPLLNGWKNWYGQRNEEIKHVIGGATANWKPTWFGGDVVSADIAYGWDYSMNDDQYFAPQGACAPLCNVGYTGYGSGEGGYISAGRRTNLTQTLTLGTAAKWRAASWITLNSHLGANYSKQKVNSLYGSTTNLAVGFKFLGSSGYSIINELGDERALAGWYFEEQASFRQDRLFLTAAIRQDAGSAMGRTVKPLYTKWNASWLISEEPFFQPLRHYVPTLRLRAATGNAGVMPPSTAHLRTYGMDGNYVLDNGSPTGSYAVLDGPGNPEVRPEHSREFEGGFDVDLFQQRLTVDATWFRKKTWDALRTGPLAGSLGPGVLSPFYGNVGDVLNTGFEIGATVRVLDSDAFGYSVNANVSKSENRLLKLAPGTASFASVGGGNDTYSSNQSKVVVGYPLFGRWAYPLLGWGDENGDGIIDPWEVRVGDSLAYVGPSLPKYTAYASHHLSFLNRRLNVDANFAYSAGMTQYNSARATVFQYTAAAGGLASQLDQACVAARRGGFADMNYTDWCFMETVKVLRLQNLSVGYTLPQSLARQLRARSATINFTADNLHHWSNYKGRDPGINTAPVTGNIVEDGGAFAAPRAYGVRVHLNF